MTMISELGMGSAIVQFRDLDKRDLNACFWLMIGIACTGYLGLYVSAPAIARWFESPQLTAVLRVSALTLPFAAIRVVPDSLLRKELALDKVSKAEIVSSLCVLPTMIALAWVGAGVWALVASTVLLPLIQSIVTIWFVRWWPSFQMKGGRFGQVVQYSLKTLGSNLTWSVFSQMDCIVLGKVAGDHVLGLYSMAKQLATLPVNKISVAVNQLAMPLMAGMQNDLPALGQCLLRGLRLVACVCIPMCMGMAFVAEDFVLLILSEKWLSLVPIFQVSCLYALVHSLAVLFPPILFARFRLTFLFWWTITLIVVMTIGFWVGATTSQGIGTAAVLAIFYPLFVVWMANVVLQEIKLDWKAIWEQVQSSFTASIVMVIAIQLVMWGMSGSIVTASERILRFALAIGIGALVYASAIVWSGGRILNEMREIAGWLLSRGRALSIAK